VISCATSRTHSWIGEIFDSEFDSIHPGRTRQRIHMRLASKMIRRGSKTTIGAASENLRNRMKFDALIRNDVGSFNPRRAGIVIVKFPRGERAVAGNPALDFDNARGPEIRPGELFLASPDQFHGTACGARQTRSFQCGVAGVLASIGGTGVWHDYANGAFRNVKDSGELIADGKRPLCARPNAQLSIGPVGYGRARLERSMSDESNGVCRVQTVGRVLERFLDGTLLFSRAVVRFGFAIFFQKSKEFFIRNLRDFLPLRMNGVESGLRFVHRWSGGAGKISIADDDHAGHGFRGAVVIRIQSRPERGRTQNFAMEQTCRA
jgi:hypothetical protein